MRLAGPFDGGWDGAAGRRECRITDLNPGGCFVDAIASNPVGTRLITDVHVSDQHFRLSSEVVYVDRVQGFAVRFIDNPAAVVEELSKALRSRRD
jgi:PilZ domain